MVVRTRARVALVAAVFVVGVLPVALDRDSFPLSTFPMFSTRRTTSEPVDTAVAVAGDRQWWLSPELIAATDEPIQATAAVSDAISAGQTDALCADIARRVGDDGPAGATAVEVITARYDAVRWFEGERAPLQRVV
ncbi:MAG TPA: hypothetical protein VF855_08495, partial [Acidimicrobiales bacterium]